MDVGFDTETRGLDWWDQSGHAFLGQWARDEGEWHADLADPEATGSYLRGLANADVIVAHNLKFDAHQTRELTGWDVFDSGAELHDTDLMSRLLFPEGQKKGERGGHGLKELASIYVDPAAGSYEERVLECAKQIGHRTLNKAGVHYDVWRAFPEVLEEYGRMDARYTLDLYHDFLPRFDTVDSRLKALYEMERKVQRILYAAERRGVRVDPEAVERLHTHYQGLERPEREALERELGFVPEGEGSRDALQEALLKLGVPLTETTDNGQLSVARKALAPFEKDFPVIAHLFEWRRIRKFISTYIEPMRGREVVHPSFMQAEAWTGRMSCRNPNMQNLPKRRDTSAEENLKLRSMFIPREGHSFVVSDFAGIEDRFLAYYCGVQEARDLITGGRDCHAFTTSVVDGGEESDYLKGTDGEFRRNCIKHARYAITYGAGGPKVMDTINSMLPEDRDPIDLAESRRIIARIKDSIPGYRGLQSRIREKVQRVGYVETILGRKQMVQPDKHYVGLNALIQGSAAEAMKAAAVATQEVVGEHDAMQLLFVHDESLTEVPTEEAEALRPKIVEAMEGSLTIDPALRVDASITDRSYAHAK